MTEWRTRYKGYGVKIYWHVETNAVSIYSQLKNHSASEAAAMIEGLIRHDTEMRVEKNFVDSHGQSEVAFAFCRLLNEFKLMPRLKRIKRERLYLPDTGMAKQFPNLAGVLTRPIRWDIMNRQYDEMMTATMTGGVPAKELEFYEGRIRANGGVALDQACGTGCHLFPLLKLGLEVHGADISADALQFAHKAAATHEVQPTLYHQRMEECDIPHRYGTIYIANATFQVISDRQQALYTLERFWRHLSPGGQLLIELFVPPEVTRGPTINDAEHPTRWEPIPRPGAEGEIVTTLWSEEVDLFEQILLSKRRYDLYVNGKGVRSEVHAHFLRWYFHYEFIMMLQGTGFEDITTYSDYTDQPATKDSKTVVYGARRPQDSRSQ